MSRADLDHVQAQLKLAIQSHQMLVAKMKADPQNPSLQKQLRGLQVEITGLSEKQKSMVQLLRKEIVHKQVPAVTQAARMQTPTPPSNTPAPRQPTPTNIAPAPPHQSTPTPPRQATPTKPLGRPSKPVLAEKAPPNQSKSSEQSAPRCQTPPIRVPQYHRPSLLQGRRSVLVKTSISGGMAVQKKPSEVEVDLKRSSFDKKQLPPEERKKLEYMAALDLITQDALKEFQNRRSERKRRSTANPQFSYSNTESEARQVKRRTFLSSGVPVSNMPRKRGRPPKSPRKGTASSSPVVKKPSPPVSPALGEAGAVQASSPENGCNDVHEDFCAVCHRSGEVLMCDTCSLVYHLGCLEPPLQEIPEGVWSCPKCVVLNKNSSNWPGTLALVHTYIALKASKEEEKKRLEECTAQLKSKKLELENKTKQYSEEINRQIHLKADMLNSNHQSQQNVDKLKNFIKVFQTS